MEADAVRRRLHPEGVVSYVVGCCIDCGAAGSLEHVVAEVGQAVELGGTGVRLGRLGSGLKAEWLERMLRGVRERFPAIWIEGPTAAEVVAMAGGSGPALGETLARLQEAGLDSIAGDGRGCSVEEWLAVHRAAHGLGMRNAAEMIFGGGETLERRVDLLEAVRRLQEESGGFAAFVPVAAEAPGGRELDGMTAVERLKTLAIARMFLDNVENVQASRAGDGLKVLQMGLRFGANDAGSVAAEGSGQEDVRRIIRDAGFMPAERDMAYRVMMLN
jgi:cyclic dehypoxanthinyl futalosine synthase